MRGITGSTFPDVLGDGFPGVWGGKSKDLVVSLAMNEGTGSTLIDQAWGRNLTTSAVTWTTVTGFPGKVATFNGSTSLATAPVAAPTAFNSNQPFTISVWIQTSAESGTGVIAGNLVNSASAPGWQVYVHAGALLFTLINVAASSRILVTTGAVISNATKYHVAFTYSGSGKAAGVTIYLNGVAQTLTLTTDTLSGSTVSTQAMIVGRDTTADTWWTGEISTLQIWRSAKSAAFITALYNAGPA